MKERQQAHGIHLKINILRAITTKIIAKAIIAITKRKKKKAKN
jgi:hypothetical protein